MTATPRPRATLWLLRVLLTAHVLAVLGQPLLAGLFLSGDVDAIVVHGVVGSALAAVGLVLVGVTLLYVLAGRGTLWILPVTVGLFLVEGVQIGFGYARELSLHIPLGVLIVTGSILLAAWSWTPWAARPRRRRTPLSTRPAGEPAATPVAQGPAGGVRSAPPSPSTVPDAQDGPR